MVMVTTPKDIVYQGIYQDLVLKQLLCVFFGSFCFIIEIIQRRDVGWNYFSYVFI